MKKLSVWATAALLTFGPVSALAETVMITGSSRGIGFEFTKRYAERGWDVIATARSPQDDDELQALAAAHDNIRIETLDVTDFGEIEALAEKMQNTPIDVLINNAGIAGGRDTQIFGRIDYSVFDDVMHVNVVGPLKITETFLPHVAASEQKKIVNISSEEGRHSRILGSRQFFYRASKSALNMVMQNVAKNPQVIESGVIIALLTPGFVDTDFTEGVDSPFKIEVEDSVAMSMEMIDKLTLEMSGRYFANTGEELPW